MTTENSSQESSTTSGSTTSSDTTSTPQSQPSSSTPQTQSAPAASASGSAAPVIGSDGQPAPYQPNYKFKAFGKEHEIDETFRGLIKDKDSEEKIRKFHEKAYAMEKFQEDRNKFKSEFEQFKTKVDPDLRAMNHFNNLLKNKDWDNFFGGLKVPEDEIFNWVQKRLELRNMDPAQRAQIEQASQARQQNYFYEQQMQQQQQSYQQLAVETRSMQLDSLMARQEVSSQAEKIDQAYGKIGAFRDLVIEEAANHWHRTGQDLPAEAAVQMAIQKFGRLVGAGSSVVVPQSGSPAPAQQAGQPTGNQAPIIPHVAGSGRSPVKKAFKSLDDLKAHAKTLT
jgi:hypothetical protein